MYMLKQISAILIIVLGIFLIIIVNFIFFIFNINHIVKLIKFYFTFLSLIVGIVLIYILYNSISFNLFIFILFLVIIFNLIIISYKKSLFQVNSKIIYLVLTKDYKTLMQKILVIKFLIFYFYVTSDYTYCDSSLTRSMQNVVTNVEQSSNIDHSQSVSIIQTMGVLATVGVLVYGGIKFYKFYKSTLPKTSNTSIEKVEHGELNLDDKVNILEMTLYDRMDTLESKLVSLQENYGSENVRYLELIGKSLLEIENLVQVIKDLLVTNNDNINSIIKLELNKNLYQLEVLLDSKYELFKRNGLSVSDVRELNSLSAELSLLLNTNKKTFIRSNSCPNLLSETSDSNTLVSGISNISSIPLSVANNVSKRVFHGIDLDSIIKILLINLDQLIQGSLSYVVFFNILKSLGIVSDSTIISENIGLSISKAIKNYIYTQNGRN